MYRLLEDDSAVAVHEYSILQMPANRAGEDAPLDLASEADKVLHGVAVGYVRYVLVDDRPGVELLCYVVGSRADGLHAPLVGPAVRVRAGEGREERVVDIDDPTRVSSDELGRQDLHVAREHHDVHAVLVEEIQDPGLLLRLGLLGDGQVVEGDAVDLGPRGEVGVVGDDERYPRLELPRIPAPQQVYEAVVVAGDQYCHPLWRVGVGDAPVHAVPAGQRGDGARELVAPQAETLAFDLQAHEER